MKLIIHRDTEKIGGSIVELESSTGSRIIIDIGLPLIDEDGSRFDFEDYKNLTVRELIETGILPDIKGVYKNDGSRKTEGKSSSLIDGLLISHAHQDHYGLLKYVNKDIKFYLTEPTKKIIDLTYLFTSREGEITNYEYISSGSIFRVGDFKITPYLMDHSAFDAQSFLIEADGKKLVYTGDFRDHGRKENTLDYFINKLSDDIDGLIMEGTNLGNEEKEIKSEVEIEAEIVKHLQEPGLVLFTGSAQNIDRIVSFYKAARKTDRILLVDVYTANVLDLLKEYARTPYPSRDFKNLKVYYPYRLTKKIYDNNQDQLAYKFSTYKMDKNDIVDNHEKIIMLVRNSTVCDLKKIKDIEKNICQNSTFIYSQWPGYLEDDGFKKLSNFISDNNIPFNIIHSSGHAAFSALEKLVNKLNPDKLFPIHTMHPEAYSNFKSNVVKLENGEVHIL